MSENGHNLNGNGHSKKGQGPFLAAYRELGNVSAAARAAGVSRSSHYLWLNTDEKYAAEFKMADEEAIERLEEEAQRRAVEGLRQYKFHEGKPVLHPETGEPYYELNFSDTLLIFLLKGRRPEVYRERYDHSGALDVNVREVVVTVPRVGRLIEE